MILPLKERYPSHPHPLNSFWKRGTKWVRYAEQVNIKGRLPPAAINYMKAFGSYSFAHFSGLYNEIRRQKLWQVLDLFVAARHRDTLCRGMMILFETPNIQMPEVASNHPCLVWVSWVCLLQWASLFFSLFFFFSPFSFQTHDHEKTFSTSLFGSLWNKVLGAEKEKHTYAY